MFDHKPIVEISRPSHGWAHIHIVDENGETFDGRFSYIQDIYSMFVHAFYIYTTEGQQVAISIDEEGTEYTIVISPVCLNIIIDRNDEPTLTRLYIYDTDFIRLCLAEFEKNFDAWITFGCFDEDDTEQIQNDTKLIKNWTKQINKYIDDKTRIWQNIGEIIHKNEDKPHE